MDLSIIDRAARVTWRGRHWTDWAMGVYYAGWVILGASTPITDPPFTAFAITSAALGAASLAALAARARRTVTRCKWSRLSLPTSPSQLLTPLTPLPPGRMITSRRT